MAVAVSHNDDTFSLEPFVFFLYLVCLGFHRTFSSKYCIFVNKMCVVLMIVWFWQTLGDGRRLQDDNFDVMLMQQYISGSTRGSMNGGPCGGFTKQMAKLGFTMLTLAHHRDRRMALIERF